MKPTELAVVGLGGVGGYFGFKLARKYAGTTAASVTFVARGETYTKVKTRGLTLLSPEHPDGVARPAKLARSVADVETADVWLICVKEYDLEEVCAQLNASGPAQKVILPLLNGVDIYERIRRIIPGATVLPACVYVASHIKERGVVEHKGNAGRIIVGPDPQRPQYNAEPLIRLLADAGILVDYQADAFPAIWTKFLFIASFGLVTARYNKPIGQVLEEAPLRERVRLIMAEIAAVAHRKAISLPPDLIEQTLQKAGSFPYDTPTSLQLDVQSDKANTELELFAGAIRAYGQTLAVPVEETSRIYAEIKELRGARQR